ncbi:MAG: bifunctional glutamate N-acetyltransferase/amino-acid acetyltransferase ArgJ [Mariprofundaceae bacterium]|nr:bifunctional glutamate N-acetyltransferase/amino-acid acetyltransferase ArgJ [Mariprofundaceae bacterium]
MGDTPLMVPGFRLGVAACGIKSESGVGKRQDLMLIACDVDAHAAGMFTQNAFRAACVDLAEQALHDDPCHIRAVIANSGNANAGTGIKERPWAEEMLQLAADTVGCSIEQVLSASTGVIGTPFPIARIQESVAACGDNLTADQWLPAAAAICTTDTFKKVGSRRIGDYTLTGMCKGAGMIHPNMATMLAFLTTDAPLPADVLQTLLKQAVTRSFNSISVDGDTSTNDTILLLSSGLGLGHVPLDDYHAFSAALESLCIELAQKIVRDGEGVSKFVTIHVTGAKNETEARTLGRTVAVSPLVKTAFAGSDANWGRIIMAMGNCDISLKAHQVMLKADDVLIMNDGLLHENYRDAQGMAVFAKPEFTLHIDLGLGHGEATVWTGDLTHDYITINAEYRS